MTYTGNPSTVPADAVRFFAGDTDNTALLLTDNEVSYAIERMTDSRLAAAMCLDALAAKYARKADFSVGEVSKRMGAISDSFRKRAQDLRTEAGKLAVPFFGGQSVADKIDLASDSDAVQPPFTSRQMDNPLARQLDGNAVDPNDPGTSGSL